MPRRTGDKGITDVLLKKAIRSERSLYLPENNDIIYPIQSAEGCKAMKQIKTVDAVGHVLCHDLTRIVKDQYKDAQFRKGHVVREEDIPMLLSMGKEHLYVWEMQPGMLHENDAAERLCAISKGPGMDRGQVKEGKIELTAQFAGLFQVDEERLCAINSIGDIIIATRHGNTAVRPGDRLAGMRVIPLVVPESLLQQAEAAAGQEPLLKLLPFVRKTAAILATGSEVQKGAHPGYLYPRGGG